MISGFVAFAPLDSSAASGKPTLLGVVTQDDFREDLDDFAADAGRYPAFYQLFWALDHPSYGWPNPWSGGMLTDLSNRGMIAYVEITTSDLTALNQGQQDDALIGMAKNIGDWLKSGANRRILIAPLPEMNLAEHDWGGDAAEFKKGYGRIRQTLLNRGIDGSQIRFVFAPLGVGDSTELGAYYPGDERVDIIGFSKFNKNNPWQDYQKTFQQNIEGLQNQVSRVKPILVSQTGSVDSGGARAAWFNDMFTKLKANDQVIGAIYYSRIGDRDYRVQMSGQLDDAFENGYGSWSNPSELSWIFDGRMDAWTAEREEMLGTFIDTWGNTFESDIEWLAANGITTGCNPPTNNRFCPNDYVTRGAMAAFLVRALGYTDSGGGDLFIDDDNSIFEADIDKLRTAGVTIGCNPPTNNRFCPNDYVTRGAMAAFLHRAISG